jgi:hypothetical protein
VPADPSADDTELTRLRAEVRMLREELARAREELEEPQARVAKLRARSGKAERTAAVLSQALADHLRRETVRKDADRRVFGRLRHDYPTPDEAEQLDVLRASPLFDAAWYLRSHHDVVRSGDEPALHFLRHAVNPSRSPSEDFDTSAYVEDHPEVLELGVNPLVHYLATPQGRAGQPYPPES